MRYTPWVVSEHVPDFSTLENLVHSPRFAGKAGQELAIALWQLMVDHDLGIFHYFHSEERLTKGDGGVCGYVLQPVFVFLPISQLLDMLYMQRAVENKLGIQPGKAWCRFIRRGSMTGSSTNTAMIEAVPLMSDARPGSVRPEEINMHNMSPAPATTGVPLASPVSLAALSVTLPITSEDTRTLGSFSRSRPRYSVTSGDHVLL